MNELALFAEERQANAVLTEENEKLIEVVRQRSHKIAELEKDAEILQTNLDAALMQVKQLREALGLLLDCAIHGYDMPEDHSYAIISRNALEQTK